MLCSRQAVLRMSFSDMDNVTSLHVLSLNACIWCTRESSNEFKNIIIRMKSVFCSYTGCISSGF